jgi:hypothetical protein
VVVDVGVLGAGGVLLLVPVLTVVLVRPRIDGT